MPHDARASRRDVLKAGAALATLGFGALDSRPAHAARVLDTYRKYAPDGYYFVTSAGLIAIGYNTTMLSGADAPKNWTDLLAPKWKDQIALGHPGFSGYVGTWTLTMRQLYGWQFFE